MSAAAGAAAPGPGDVLMILPAARVVLIEPRTVELCIPDRPGAMRVTRGVYDVYRRFHVPRPVAEVLSGDATRQARLLECIRMLAGRGYLVTPEVGITPLAGAEASAPEPEPGCMNGERVRNGAAAEPGAEERGRGGSGFAGWPTVPA